MVREARPLIIAHRGASARAPENTLAAIRMAIDVGSDGVEFDVRLAADGVPVVIHDPTLKRVAGRRYRVSDLASEELGKIDVGSWFNAKHRTRARPEFAGEGVPTLEQVLGLLSGNDLIAYVELKRGETTYQPLVSAVGQLLDGSPLLSRVIIKSFHLDAIAEVRRVLPGVATAALFKPSLRTVLSPRHMIAEASRLGSGHISVHHRLASVRFSSLAAGKGLPLAVWTINDHRWLVRNNVGIAAVITNDPATMIQSLRSKSS